MISDSCKSILFIFWQAYKEIDCSLLNFNFKSIMALYNQFKFLVIEILNKIYSKTFYVIRDENNLINNKFNIKGNVCRI